MKYHLSIISGNPLEGQSPLKGILPSALFDVGLPTLDVYSDLSLIIPWFIGGHYIYGASMTFPIMLCFLATAYKWYRIEESTNKRWSWVFLLLQLWPQLRAIRVMKKLYQGDTRAYENKKHLNSELGSIEPFLESWPSLIIMTAIWCHAMGASGMDNMQVVFGGTRFSFAWYWTTYVISVAAGSLGITKLLQIGPCPVLTEEGKLGGLLSCTFFTHFLAVAFSMGTKAAILGMNVGFVASGSPSGMEREWPNILICFMLALVPNIMLSLISIGSSTGCNKKLFRMIVDYPALWLLPAATFFVVGPVKKKKWGQICDKDHSNHRLIGVSGKLTALNIILTTVMYAIIFLLFHFNVYLSAPFNDHWVFSFHTIGYGIVSTLYIFAILMTFFCFRCGSNTKNCCNASCCNVNKQKHYIKISKNSDLIETRYRVDDM